LLAAGVEGLVVELGELLYEYREGQYFAKVLSHIRAIAWKSTQNRQLHPCRRAPENRALMSFFLRRDVPEAHVPPMMNLFARQSL